jgi:hypothetical protein
VVELIEDDSRSGAVMQVTSSGGREYVTVYDCAAGSEARLCGRHALNYLVANAHDKRIPV